MNIRESIARSLEEQRRTLMDMPEEVTSAIAGVLEDMDSGVTAGRAPADMPYGFSEYVNVIPSRTKCACTPILITYCYDKDSFEGRIMESLDHATVHCPGICRHIFFLTTQWDSKVTNKLAGYIEAVRKNDVKIAFIHITNKGIVLMPV